MNKEQELENYLSISPKKFGIYLFEPKSSKNLYKEEFIFNENSNFLNLNELKLFLDKHIFKIEKLGGQFIKNIHLIYEDNKILNLEIGIKKKNYNTYFTKKYLENSLIEAKDIFRQNYANYEIMHMIINKFLVNGNRYLSFDENIKCDDIALEIQFISISNNIVYDLNKILNGYQIKIIKYLDGSYVKNNFNDYKEISEMSHKILRGYNKNEVSFVPKNTKKLAFFEKFFQLFS